MKFTANRETMVAALARVQGVVTKRTTHPALSRVMIDASADGLRFIATDLDVTVNVKTPAGVQDGGVSSVDGRRLFDAIKSMRGETVTVSVGTDHKFAIKCGRAKFVLNGAATDDFPKLPTADGAEMRRVDRAAIAAMIRSVLFSASTDEARPNLCGIYFKREDGGKARAVTTDGHRLSMVTMVVEPEAQDAPDAMGVIIPRKGALEIQRASESSDGDAEIGFTDAFAVARFANMVMFVRLIDAAFPDYMQVVPRGNAPTSVVDRLEMLSAVKRIGLVASDKTSGIRCAAAGGTMTITADNSDAGSAHDEIEADGALLSGRQFACSGRYIRDVLAACESTRVEIGVSDALAPIAIRPADGADALYVVMPMRA